MKSWLKKSFPKLYIKYLKRKKGINRSDIESKISQIKVSGVNQADDLKIIVSLTTYGERLSDIHLTLYSLLTQNYKPWKIILCLAEEEFPNKELDLPAGLKDIIKWGVEIIWSKDIRSYKKLIPTKRIYPNNIIVTADDDLFYPETWLEELVLSYKKNPKHIHVHNSTRIKIANNQNLTNYSQWKLASKNTITLLNFIKSGSGALFPPNSLHGDLSNQELFQKLTPTADDIWFWAMAVYNNTKIVSLGTPISSYRYTSIEREFGNQGLTLHEINVQQGRNDEQIQNILSHYPCILERLINEHKKSAK